MIAEGVLAIEYGASAEDIGRTSHAHVSLFVFLPVVMTLNLAFTAHAERSVQGGGYGCVLETYTHVIYDALEFDIHVYFVNQYYNNLFSIHTATGHSTVKIHLGLAPHT